MDENRMVPRIVVPNDDDAELIASALVGYLHAVFARVQLTGDIIGAVENGRRAIDLLGVVVDNATEQEAKRAFGPMPSDEDMAEQLKKFREEFGG